MFDTIKIGRKIAALRKAKDMTQVELADKMMVSYQAVSNWERGNSLPDISKLADLSQILGVSIEELLDSEKEARIVEKILEHPQEVSLEETAKFAPILKPSQIEEMVDDSGLEIKDLDLLVGIAPFISSEKLFRIAQKIKSDDLNALVQLAPFLDEDDLVALLGSRAERMESSRDLVGFAPFLSSEKLLELVQKFPLTDSMIDDLVGLAPFLEEDDLENLLETIPEEQILSSQIVGLAPFLSSEKVAGLFKRAMSLGKTSLCVMLMPFVDEKDIF